MATHINSDLHDTPQFNTQRTTQSAKAIQVFLADNTFVGWQTIKFTTPHSGYFHKNGYQYRVYRPDLHADYSLITHESPMPGARLTPPEPLVPNPYQDVSLIKDETPENPE